MRRTVAKTTSIKFIKDNQVNTRWILIAPERRFCDRCMMRTIHDGIEEEDVVYTYKRKRLYRCKTCGRTSFKRGLRPSAESVY